MILFPFYIAENKMASGFLGGGRFYQTKTENSRLRLKTVCVGRRVCCKI